MYGMSIDHETLRSHIQMQHKWKRSMKKENIK